METTTFKITLHELKILSVLESEEKYGYQILKELGENMLLGSIYNSLKQMENKGLVKSKWGDAEEVEGARRKYYTITGEGLNALRQAMLFFAPKWGLQSVTI